MYKQRMLDSKPLYYNTGESCSVWFEATEVWQIRGADLTLSPVHTAAIGRVNEGRGIGLRFPRFIGLRPDRTPEVPPAVSMTCRRA